MKVRIGAQPTVDRRPTGGPAEARGARNIAAQRLEDVLEIGRANIHETLAMQTRSRGMPVYVKALPGVSEVLARLTERRDVHWMDGGAGANAAAVLGFLEFGVSSFRRPEYRNGEIILPERRPPRDMRVTLVDLDCRATPTDRVRVHTGRFIEQIPPHELPPCDLITEVEGPFSYSTRPDLVLAQYVGALKDDGVLFLGLGSTLNLCMPGRDCRVVCADGQVRTYIEWLQTLKGLIVVPRHYVHPDDEDRYETLCAEIRRKPGEALEIPAVTTLRFEGGGPPRTLLKDTAADLSTRPDVQAEVEASSRASLANVALALDTGELLDQFRSGPLDTSLVRAASREGGWRHAGALSPAVAADLAAGRLDRSKRYPVGPQLAGLVAPRAIDFATVGDAQALAGASRLALITDQGVLAASPRPDLVLRTYLDALAPEGELFVAFGSRERAIGSSSRVLTRKEKDVSLAEWLRTIPGLDVEVHRQLGDGPETDETFARVRVTDREAVAIRTLEPLGARARDGRPASLLFREDLNEPAPEATVGDVMNGLALRVWKAMW